jgi:hypothetical protein
MHPSQHNFKVHPGGLFQVEDSDEDSVNGSSNNNNSNQGGNNNQGGSNNNNNQGGSNSKQTVAANRNGIVIRGSKNAYSGEKLDPIPLPLNSGEELSGVLSGKRYDSRSSFPLKKDSKAIAASKDKDVELGVNNNNAYSGFSAIYPTIASSATASEERSKKDRVSNPTGVIAAGHRIQRRNNSQDQLDLISNDEGHQNNEGNSNFGEAAFNDNALQLQLNNIRPKLVVQQQGGSQQAKQNAALIRLKSHGLAMPSSNMNIAMNNANNSNINSSNAADNVEVVNSLNVCGNGFGDRQGVNGDVAAMIRPMVNKNRNNSR